MVIVKRSIGLSSILKRKFIADFRLPPTIGGGTFSRYEILKGSHFCGTEYLNFFVSIGYYLVLGGLEIRFLVKNILYLEGLLIIKMNILTKLKDMFICF